MSPNKNKPVTNIGASVRAQLLNIARESGQDYNRVLIRYAQERLLYRFSASHYRSNFITVVGYLHVRNSILKEAARGNW